MTNAELPCAKGPCPHKSCCCQFGVSLTLEEFKQIAELYGFETVARLDPSGELRTQVEDGRCVFLHGGCELHGTPLYPSVCKAFPYDGYEGDRTICPECIEK